MNVEDDQSVARYLNSLRKRLTPERLEVIDAVLGLDLTGPEGGRWTIDGRRGVGGGLLDGPPEAHGLEARCRGTMSAADYRRMARGELKPHAAVLTGRLKVKGDLPLLLRLARVFAP